MITVYHGSDSISLGTKFWNNVPEKVKAGISIGSFKKSVRKWIPENYPPDHVCHTYVE